ncbi:MAG: ABC transporter permease [Bacteroidetes bacterium]|nr:ABC transporter permease [Bacteroidota bacterium]
MLKNYFKIAIAVLKRRKFFTFISLFGISFTLTIMMVLAAFIENVIGNDYPDRKRDRSLYITSMEERGKNAMSSGSPSFYFLNKYAATLKTPAKISICSNGGNSTNTYVNNKKIAINYKYTDANYWDILEYDFVEGKAFDAQQVKNGEHVAVISEGLKKEYFGDIPSVVGKYIEADNVQYRISGVVKNVPITTYMLYSDIYIPYTVSKIDYLNKDYQGGYIAILLAASKADLQKISNEYDDVMKRVPMENKDFDHMNCRAESYMRSFLNTGNEDSSGLTEALTAIGVFTLIVMLLPTINLININVTRIMERSSEIGVRKAFGASSKTLVYQFIVENLILTLLGGLIGIILSYIIIQIINSADLIPYFVIKMNLMVLLIALLICFVFGLFSGVYPAWRMSKLNVVTALKEQ